MMAPAPHPATPATRPPGRPRSAHADQAIQDAAIELFVELGFEAMSMEGVAARAGVGKTTIYRRWDSKADLVMDAMVCHITTVDDPDTGSVREDLVRLITAFQQAAHATAIGHVFPRMVAEVADSSALGHLYSRRVIEPRKQMLRSIFLRGVDRGELPAEADLELGIDLIMGPVMLRRLLGKVPIRGARALSERHVDVVLAGLAANVRGGRGGS
jgi:AcrR family transcriptional regulator